MNLRIKKYDITFWEQSDKFLSVQIKKVLNSYLIGLTPQDISVLQENEYIERNFSIDYSNYYSRSFNSIPKKVIRYHFFSLPQEKLRVMLNYCFNGKLGKPYQCLRDSYLGYIVIKPTHHFGKIVLHRFPEAHTTNRNICRVQNVYKSNKIHLFGLPFILDTLPFQEQDQAVAACATISIWTALQCLADKFKLNVRLAPSEITTLAFDVGGIITTVKFPNEGLNIYQIINVFSKLGFHVLTYDVNNAVTFDKNYLPKLLMSYLRFGIPILATLNMKKYKDDHFDNNEIGHAVVISGFQFDKKAHKITELYVHDDQVGPYSAVKFVNDDITSWQYEWLNKCKEVQLDLLLVPLYPKIRLNFTKLYIGFYLKHGLENFNTEIFLTDINAYKKSLIEDIIKNLTGNRALKKSLKGILYKQLPRYLWIIRCREKDDTIITDFVIDATEENINVLECINFF